MNELNNIYQLLVINQAPNKNSGDIKEHLETLYEYSKECDSVFETGVRGCISSWAFLNDIDTCDITELLSISKNFDVEITYEWKNNLLLELDQNYDITFIDTWHVYGQLKRELDKFSKITNKYIIMHDTTSDEIFGETIRLRMDPVKQSNETGIPFEEIIKGLWPAITEFLLNNPEWYIKERFINNNGLTILARK